MMTIDVLDRSGEKTSSVQIDEAKLGGKIHLKLLKEAVLMYEANKRQGTGSSKSRHEVAGSNRKIYRQKGTGHARMGMNRTPLRRGGGAAFGPRPRDFGWNMPKKARRLAVKSALLAKLKDDEVKAVEGLTFDEIKTKQAVELLKSLKVDGTCLLVSAEYNRNLLLSARNLPGVGIAVAAELNARDVLKYRWLVIEKPALEALAGADA